jgi:hypothetical protein
VKGDILSEQIAALNAYEQAHPDVVIGYDEKRECWHAAVPGAPEVARPTIRELLGELTGDPGG